MPKRFPADLGHLSACVGKIGRLHSMATIPIVAGDSIDLDFTSVFRMSPLRRALAVDARVDLFGFFVPHRHVYGDSWKDFIKKGVDEDVTFSTVTVGSTSASALNYLASGNQVFGTVPLWLLAGYNRIWNRFFRVPAITPTELADDYFPTGTNDRKYGKAVAFLPSYLTPTSAPNITDDDHKVTVDTGKIDIIDIEKVKARYKTEIEREWFNQRYADIIKNSFSGVMINADAEERPELLFREVNWMSGHDVDGTGEGNLGQYAGKSQAVFQVRMPRKFFPEHGTLWIMCAVRYPTMVSQHSHYLVCNSNPSYKEWAGDPDIISAEPPVELLENDFIQFKPSNTNSFGYFPYAQWYRFHPNTIHDDFQNQDGYPFLDNDDIQPGALDEITYSTSGGYDDVFQSSVLGHYQSFTKFNIPAMRIVPPAIRSIYAGV